MTCGSVASLVLEGDNLESNSFSDETVAINLNLKVYDETIKGRIVVADRPAGLCDVVPVARVLSDEIVRRVVECSKRAGLNVPCQKGCAACCRYLVPLSVPEMFRMWNELRQLPQGRQKDIMYAFVKASQQILQAGVPPVPQSRVVSRENSQDSQKVLNRWYAEIGAVCPFLEREACTAYPFRPVACREHAVTSPVENCLPAEAGQVQRLELPFSIVEALGILAAEMEGTEVESIMLPFVPAWRQINHDLARRQWPAPDLFERFAAIVHNMSARSRLAAADAA